MYQFITVIIISFSSLAFANCDYTSKKSGDWTQEQTWKKNSAVSDPSTFPNAAHDVCIKGDDRKVTVSTAVSALTITVSGEENTLDIKSGASLTITDDLEVKGEDNLVKVKGDLAVNSGGATFKGESSVKIFSTGTFFAESSISLKSEAIFTNNASFCGAVSTYENFILNGVNCETQGSQVIVAGLGPIFNGNASSNQVNNQGGIIQNCGALPIELLAFNARLVDEQEVEVTWKTAMEIDNKEFEVQRSLDGRTFETIHTTPGTNQGPGDNQPVEYTYNDTDLPRHVSILYYRLKQTDFDDTE